MDPLKRALHQHDNDTDGAPVDRRTRRGAKGQARTSWRRQDRRDERDGDEAMPQSRRALDGIRR